MTIGTVHVGMEKHCDKMPGANGSSMVGEEEWTGRD